MDRLFCRVSHSVVHCVEPRAFLSYLLGLVEYLVFGSDILAAAGVSDKMLVSHECAFDVLVGVWGNLL
jgi:hypothetical protein